MELDIKVGYGDNMNWRCLEDMTCCMGFGRKWRDWAGYCVSSARFLVLVDGYPKGFFKCGRGLRQGDSLSPLLFTCGRGIWFVVHQSRRIIARLLSGQRLEIGSVSTICR